MYQIMKINFIIALSLILMVIGCTTVVEETSKPIVKPAQESFQKETNEEKGVINQSEPIELPEDNIIQIKYEGFDPNYLLLNKSKTVIWDNLDNRQHLIACYYYGGGRVFIGEKLNQGDKTTHTFEKYGTYICVDAIYGLRGTVVIYKMPEGYLSPITGGAIGLPKTDVNVPVSWIVVLLVTLSTLYVYLLRIKKSNYNI